MTVGTRRDWIHQGPVVVGFLIQILMFTFYLGSLQAEVKAIRNELSELKTRFATVEMVKGLDARVERLDIRLTTVEHSP